MTASVNRQAMLASILDNPECDTLRLAYADLLDEEGDTGAELRRIGYWTFSSGPLTRDPTFLWWHRPGSQESVRLGIVNQVPVCAEVAANACGEGPGTKAGGYYFGEWRCLQCAAKYATRNKIGIWAWLAEKAA